MLTAEVFEYIPVAHLNRRMGMKELQANVPLYCSLHLRQLLKLLQSDGFAELLPD